MLQSNKKAFTLVEILVALAVIGTGLIGLLSVLSSFVDIANNIQDRTMARLIAQNYVVAIQRFVSENGYDKFIHDASIGFKLEKTELDHMPQQAAVNDWHANKAGTINGSIRLIDIAQLSPSSKTFSPSLMLDKTLFPELENSNGQYWVRILFQQWQYSPEFEMKIIKISVGRYDRIQEEKHYDFWYCVTNYINFRSPRYYSAGLGDTN